MSNQGTDRWQVIVGIATVVGAIAGLMVVPEVSHCWRSRPSEARSVPVSSKAGAVVRDEEKAPLPLRTAPSSTVGTATINNSAAVAAAPQTRHGYTITLQKITGAPTTRYPVASFVIVNKNPTDHQFAFDCAESFLVDQGGKTHTADQCHVAGSRTDRSSGQLLVPGITYMGSVSYYGYDALQDEKVIPVLRLECFDTTDNAKFILEFRNVPISMRGRS